jgi:sugar phosphate isomerase/epimerase
MELKTFKATWGMTGDWDSMLRQIAEAGYTGVECGVPAAAEDAAFREALATHKLELILQVYTDGDHRASFEQQVERAVTFRPVLINSHSGKDSMSYDEQLQFFENAIRIERQIGIPVGHETHRGRAMFTPWSTARLLRDLPELHLVADISHWCTVCESMLPDQADNVALTLRHAVHIHARVGYEQGPQVPDFRAPEYEYALDQHERWWGEIASHHRESGRPYLTMTPEFGPPAYMHTQPFTNQPVVDLWEICYAMKERFKGNFNSVYR